MIQIAEIILIFENTPLVLQYFVPGYWALSIFRYFCSKKMATNITTIMSCVISYALISLVAILREKEGWFETVDNTPLINSAIAILIGTIIAASAAIIFSSKSFSKAMVFFFQKTPNDVIWRDIIDFKEGSNLKIYVKDKDYCIIGHCRNYENKGGDSWLAVSAFMKCDKVNYTLLETHENDSDAILAIRLSDVEHIEIFN